MARPLTGSVMSRVLADGSVAFDVKIRRDLYTLGRTPEWSDKRAQKFLAATLLPAAKLRQEWWELIPERRTGDASPEVTVWTACTEWVEWRITKSLSQLLVRQVDLGRRRNWDPCKIM
jgi:hypothetical protein